MRGKEWFLKIVMIFVTSISAVKLHFRRNRFLKNIVRMYMIELLCLAVSSTP